MNNILEFPWWKKQLLTLEEASIYYGIGEKNMRRLVRNLDDELLVRIGAKTLVKKDKFMEYLNDKVTVI
ncbi:MAG: transposase [Lachnospiraceae bacterium]|nr:transposase [Lachnospiraceae bacterium]